MFFTKTAHIFVVVLAVMLSASLCGCDLPADISDVPQQTSTTTVVNTTVSQTTAAATTKAATTATTTKATTAATTVKTTTTAVATTAAPTTTKAPEITANTTAAITVYIYPTGEKFHIKAGCSGDNYSAVTLERARGNGYTACKKCAKAYAE